ncbi:sulfurtransferase [Aquimarina algiphila]|uniref:sulfurtransferase n=1 Tax=Aquimarina algiphila TaxID=2047982 RepID=UPI0023307CF8|nr:sulfurtransferase [Aquimarina algiphila]
MKNLEITTPLVSVSWLSKHLDHPDLIILDATIKKVTSHDTIKKPNVNIKNARFFDIKHTFSDTNTDIPNMLSSPETFSEACRALGISSHHKIVIYDKLGIYSSPRVWWMFKAMGHNAVAVLDGGLPSWQKAGLPCEPEENSIKITASGNFEATLVPNLIQDADAIVNAMNNNDILILDARSPGRFTGIEPEPRKSLKGGHIPNSINLYYTKVLNNGKMLPTSELLEILKPFSIENKKLIFTCGSGITACILMLASELVGYHKVSIYDGSWSEWGQLDGVPIEC